MKYWNSFLALALIASGAFLALVAIDQIEEGRIGVARSLPRDPAVRHEGAIWLTDMFADAIDGLHPKTGAIQGVLMKTRESGPQGRASGRDGNLWFTVNGASHIGELSLRAGP
jgi:streptogramin lyase